MVAMRLRFSLSTKDARKTPASKTGWNSNSFKNATMGAKIASSYGYKKGIRDRRRADKYTKQYSKFKG